TYIREGLEWVLSNEIPYNSSPYYTGLNDSGTVAVVSDGSNPQVFSLKNSIWSPLGTALTGAVNSSGGRVAINSSGNRVTTTEWPTHQYIRTY